MTSLAKGTGWRKFGDATHVPSPIRSVTAAAAASNGTVANHGSSARSRHARWSYVHAWSKPISSTRCHRVRALDHRSCGSSTTPTLTMSGTLPPGPDTERSHTVLGPGDIAP